MSKGLNEVSVRNLLSPRSGREVPNQFMIHCNKDVYFQSYDSVCACYHLRPEEGGYVLILGYYWDYSRTTLKYFREWLGELGLLSVKRMTTEEIRKAIKKGWIEYNEELR